jgi:hypothetical protein
MKFGLKRGKIQRVNKESDWNIKKNIDKINIKKKKRNKERRDNIK